MLKNPVFIMVLSFFLLGSFALPVEPKFVYGSPYTDIDVDTAYDMITTGSYPDLIILDVRTKGEYDSGHIYDATWIPVAELESRIEELASHKEHEIIVYCHSGGRSLTASAILDSNDFTKVFNMLGGITAWQSSGYPVWIATVHNMNTTNNYDTIQAAIDAANPGDTILAHNKTYDENIVVSKSLSLLGESKKETIINGDQSGDVVQITTDNVNITGFTIKNGRHALKINGANNNTINGNTITGIEISGIWLNASFNNVISGNNITNNRYGISLLGNSSNNIIRDNAFTNNGLSVRDSYQNSVENNTVNGKPLIYLESMENHNISEAGQVILIRCNNIRIEDLSLSNVDPPIYLLNTNNSHTLGNYITANIENGLLLERSFNNVISGNNITNNRYGISLLGNSSNNIIYHNNFIDNTQQFNIEPGCTSIWDQSYPSGGNYWSDYTGIDFYSGPYQNETSCDGIGDIPNFIDTNNQDNYPLMMPWGCRVTYESNTTITYATITVNGMRFGTDGPDEIVGYINVTIPIELNSTTIRVYIDGVEIMPPPFPVITSNNTHYFVYFEFTQSSHNLGIKLKAMPWDITGTTMWVPDGRCDMRDVGLIARLFGSIEGDGNYDDRADIAGPTNGADGKIDMRDVGLVARHFGETL